MGRLDHAAFDKGARSAMRGLGNFHRGLSGEAAVHKRYAALGHRPLAQRWRGSDSEVDLIFEDKDGAGLIFIEVKSAASHATATTYVSPRQSARFMRGCEEFAGDLYGRTDVEMRLDLALVDGYGRVDVIENAFFN